MRIPLIFLAAAVAAIAAPRQVGYDPLKQLVLDSRTIERLENARLVLGQPVKDPRNPLFKADRPWENSTNNLYPNVRWDEQDQVFKLWYKNVLADADAIAQMDGPSTVHTVGWYLLYATSKDGIAWEKPALGLHRFNGSAATNIVARDTPNAGVFKDDHDPDARRRYKMVYDVGLGRPRARFSSDGVHWDAPFEPQGFSAQHGDTHNNAFWDPRIKKYVWFTKLYIGERLVARFESDDFVHWKSSGMVLRSSVQEGRVSQTYCMPVFQYGNVYLSYMMMYNVGKGRSVDCELAWSHDGVRWQRLAPGTAFIPRGPSGSYDSECIYAQAGPATVDDGQLLIYYGGSDFPHTGWKRHCLPSLARLRADGFAGYEAAQPGKPAVLTTQPVVLVNDQVTISADVVGGSVVVEVLDEQNRIMAAAQPIIGNVTDQPVELDLTRLRGRTARIRFTLNGARLYAFGGVKLTREELTPPPPDPLPRVAARAEPIRITFDENAAGWKGVDQLEHQRNGADGYITLARGNKLHPFAISPPDPKDSPFIGDWVTRIGGSTSTVTCRIHTPRSAGKLTLEIFAKDTPWSKPVLTPAGEEWEEFGFTLRYDWTDAEAEAAGWTRSASAFSWRDTIRNVGKLHVVFVPDQTGPREIFDLDEVAIRGHD